ncbi:MAG TPA: membrane protein insertase YidC [Candidatus Kryptonia bacterium]
MGKTETVGIIIITLLLFVWMYFNSPKQPPRPQQQQTTEQSAAPPQEQAPPVATSGKPTRQPEQATARVTQSDTSALRLFGKTFSPLTHGVTKTISIQTDLYTAVLTTRGGMIREWSLADYKTWRGNPVQLVSYNSNGDYSLLFQTMDGKLIDTKDLFFKSSFVGGEVITLSKDQTFKLSFTATVGDSSQIVREYTFKGGVYDFGSRVTFKKMDPYIANFQYQVNWEHGIQYAEENSVDESSYSTAYAFNGGEAVSLDASKVNAPVKQELAGRTDWVSQTTKYFTVAIAAKDRPADGAYLYGSEVTAPDNGLIRTYYTSLEMRFEGQPFQSDSFMVYAGPLDYRALRSYNIGLEETVGLGWKWIVRPIAEYVFLPMFRFFHTFIPNYGLVIILFSLIIKVALNPLTVSSMKSMKKMQALQPMMNEIKEKYKEDPQKMNQAVMSLYKEYKINPMGGCLPMVLQMPILYALWAIFRSNIALRQANFIWWMKDLSVPDTIVHLPFTVPFLGVNQISGLAFLMAVTMLVQQKMSIKDPRQQFMVWFMPVMFWLIFNNLPSGLNLYYFVFNILSIGQQYLLNRKPAEAVLVKPPPPKKPGRARPALGNRFMRRNS